MEDLFRTFRSNGNRRVRDHIVFEYRWVALHCARRFERRGEPKEDLEQVAQLGLIKAVERFDPERGSEFVSFAIPTILGELRRHFRDTTWAVKVSRRMKDLSVTVGPASEELTATLGRSPTVDELADHIGVDTELLLEALEARTAYRTSELDPGPADEESTGLARGVSEEHGYELVEARETVDSLIRQLPERERNIVVLHYFDGLSQADIGALMGISQVHVSRLMRSALTRLRDSEVHIPA